MTARARVVLATRNPGKAREISAIYGHLDAEFVTLGAWPELGELPEHGATYAENAVSKARAAAAATGCVALADDSGIEIDALDGAPGPRSRRFLGDDASDADRNAHVLALLREVPEAGRTARYRAAVAVALPDGAVHVVEGTCEGRVARAPHGGGGFGYDPVFVATADGRTMAELSLDEKNRISHRARALRAAEPHLRAALATRGKEPRPLDANTTTGPRRAGRSTDDPRVGGRP
ncbi:MAG TPA: RdgB/HAM1 family non-canonical purine NTP pyrophosphatase [bacterium]|nr:RdgB/HAM1 family non-canonical purine NTP pyrophosphatase [bacterium]